MTDINYEIYLQYVAKQTLFLCLKSGRRIINTVLPPLINPVTHDIVVNESDKANVLNNYFCSISSTANNIDPSNLPRRTPFSLDVDDIHDDDVKDILKSLQIGKASGGDFISHQMLKNTADTVYLPLKYIFNHSLRVSKYPSCWKIANVLSLQKGRQIYCIKL